MKSIEKILVDIAALATLALSVVITTNIILRTFFASDVPDSVIIVRDLMVPAITLPLAAATAARAHVSVTFISDMFSPRARGVLIIAASCFGLIALMPLIYAAGREFLHNWSSGEFNMGVLNLPRWPANAVFLLGLAALWIRLLLNVFEDVGELRRTGEVSDQHQTEGEEV